MTQNDGRWKPGQSGNPQGRPRKGHALSESLRRELEQTAETVGSDGQVRTKADVIAEKAVELAMGGDVAAIKFLADRLEGKAAQTHAFEEKREMQSVEQCLEELRRTTVNPRPSRRPAVRTDT